MKEAMTKTKTSNRTDLLELKLEQKDAELKIINSVGEAMSKQLDVKTVTKIVGDNVREIFHTEVTEILLLNYDTDMIEIPFSYYKGYREFEAFKLGEGLTSKVIKSQKPLLLKSLEEQVKNGAVIQSEEDKTESYMGVPILFDGKVLGVVSVQSYKKDVYNENNVQLLLTLSTSMGIALQNAKLFETTQKLLTETEQRTAELTIINSVGEAMSKQLDIGTVTKIVGDKVREIFKAEVTEILLLGQSGKTITVPYSFYKGYQEVESFELGSGLTSEVIKSGKPLLLSTFEEQSKHGALLDEGVGEADYTETYLGVPILFNEKILGVVSIQSYEKNAYDENHIRLLSTLSTNMGVTLQNAKLFEETKRLLSETEQRNSELGVINSVQEGLVAKMDIQSIYDLVGEKIRGIFNAQVVSIGSYNHKKGMCEFKYDIEKGERFYDEPRKFNAIDKHLIKSKKVLLINDNLVDKIVKLGEKKPKAAEGTEMAKSAVWVPMVVKDEVKGYVSLQDVDNENALSESDVRLLTTLTNSMSVALENASLFDQTKTLLNEMQQRNSELGVINSVQEGLVKQVDLQAIYDLVGDQINAIFDTQVVAIASFNLKEKTETFNYVLEKGERYYPESRKYDKVREYLIKNKDLIHISENYSEAAKKYGMKVVEGTEMPKSLLFVPMIVGKTVNGYITLQNIDRENAFSESDVRLLTTLANSMSVALENARLFKETEQRNAELAVINSVQEGLVAEMDMQGIYNLVGDKVRDLFDAQVTGIYTFDHEAEMEHFQYLFEDGERLYPESRPLNQIRKWIIKNASILLVNENAKENMFKVTGEQLTAIPGTRLPKSLLFVPLIVGENVRGCVSLQNLDKENAFSESDVRLLGMLANSMSVALENARLFDETTKLLEETKQQAIELKIINSVGDGLAKQMDFQSIIDLVGEKIREVFNAQVVSISTYEKDIEKIHHRYAVELDKRYYFDKPQAIDSDRKEIIETKQPLIFGTAQEAIEHSGEEVVAGEMPESFMGVPIVRNQEVTGVITVQDIERQNLYTKKDVRLLMTLASNMGVALENARLFEETKRLLNETQQRNVELSILNAIQEGLVEEMEFEAIINLVGDKFREALGFMDLGIRLYDKENDILHFPYEYEHGERLFIDSMAPTPLSKYVLETGKTLYMKKATDEEIAKLGITGQTVIPGTDDSKSLVFVPIIVGSEPKGLILVENYEKEDAFSESEIRLLTTVANSMSVALENARLFDETNRLLKVTEQRSAELSVINSVQEGLAKELDLQGIYELVGERLCTLFPDSQTLVIRSFDLEERLEHWQYAIEKGVRLKVEPRPFNWANKLLIRTKKPLDIRDNYSKTAQKYGGKGVTKGKPPKSAVFVPIIINDAVRGSISLQNIDKENAFDDSDVRLVTTLVNSMSVALENARLFNETTRLLDETQQRNTELSIINTIQDGMVKEMDFDGVINLVGNKLQEVLNYKDIGIRIYDKETNLVHFPYEYEHGVKLEIDPMPPGSISSYVLKNKKMLLVPKNDQETFDAMGLEGISVIPGTDRSKSFIAVPLITGNEARGLFIIENYEKENAFDESDVRLLTTLANSMSVALENARLFNETLRLLDESKKRTDELSTVNSISQAIVGHLEIDKLINLVGDKVRDLFKANIVYLALLDKDKEFIEFPYGYGEVLEPLKFGEGLTSHIIVKKEPLLINREADKKTEELGVERIGTPSASFLGVPIPVGDEIIGVLSVQSTERENVFNEDDMRLLGTIAAHVGIAINNANAYEELNKTLENLQSTQDQLIAQEKLASLGQLTAGIAHEIKNPLNFVNNFSELSVGLVDELKEEFDLLKDKFDAETLADLIDIMDTLKQNSEKIKEHGKRADSIVHSMLQHSRGKTGEKQPTDLNAMLDEDLNLVYHGMRAQDNTFNIKIEREYDKSISEVNIIPQDMSRVFLNIMSNGCYESHRRKVESNSDEPAKITVKTSANDKYVEVRVRDNGFGIPKKIRENLFTPFFTTKPSGKGTGLGLSISYDIVVREHNGELLFETETEENSFTEFIVRLPNNAK